MLLFFARRANFPSMTDLTESVLPIGTTLTTSRLIQTSKTAHAVRYKINNSVNLCYT